MSTNRWELRNRQTTLSSDPITERLYQVLLKDNGLNYAAHGDLSGVSEATVKRLGELKERAISSASAAARADIGRC